MNRATLINAIISKTTGKSYLEIGCYRGKTFYKIQAAKKIGVDPNFHREFYIQWIKSVIKSPKTLKNIKFYRQTSDDFFFRRKSELKKMGGMDIIFIDGLHTFRASLNDLLNALQYLNDDGVIVLHDCFPPNAAAATPSDYFPTPEEAKSIPGWTGAWCGDVWKTMVYTKMEFSKELDVWVLNTDNGLGIVKPKPGVDFRNLMTVESRINEINSTDYTTMVNRATELLNLVEEPAFKKILLEITEPRKQK